MEDFDFDFGGFDINDDVAIQDGAKVSSEKAIEEKAIKRKIKNDNLHFVKAKALSDLCIAPKANEQYRIITEKQFNAYALILHVLEQHEIDELYLAIYRINEPTVKSIIDFIEQGKIKKARFVISNFFTNTKKPERWAILLRDFCKDNDNSECVYIHNHSKVLALKTSSNDYFVFEGSGNMSDNARIEQYVYENNKAVFDFHKDWISGLIDRK